MAGLVITGAPLLICEGADDKAFADALIRLRNLQQFDLDVIGDHEAPLNRPKRGITALRHHLPNLVGLPNFRLVSNIALLTDNDKDYATTMQLVQNEIRVANQDPKAAGRFPIPRSAHKKWRKKNLTFTVILQPGNRKPGCLETAVWQVMSRLYGPKAVCVESALTCSGINHGARRWGNSKLDKARVRAGIAVTHKRRPSLSFTQVWDSPLDWDLIPIQSVEFDDIFGHLAAV